MPSPSTALLPALGLLAALVACAAPPKPSPGMATAAATMIELPDGTACRADEACTLDGRAVRRLDIGELEVTVELADRDGGTETLSFPIERVELADGAQCPSAGQGATLAFEGKRLNYTCLSAPVAGLIGGFDVTDGVATAEGVVLGHSDGEGFTAEEIMMFTVGRVVTAAE
ncbi:hypothetical protein [Inquilinus sp. CAU 1745]|uniref:hypothetical protein n=1 Tax=Inquilinus sp. CAU 1745 TaxID=3140369 RepID=UPI00325A73E2